MEGCFSPVKSTWCSWRKPKFSPQHPHGSLLPAWTLIPVPCSCLHGYQAFGHVVYIHTFKKNTHTHIKKIKVYDFYVTGPSFRDPVRLLRALFTCSEGSQCYCTRFPMERAKWTPSKDARRHEEDLKWLYPSHALSTQVLQQAFRWRNTSRYITSNVKEN